MTLNFEAASHIGYKRRTNEDRYFTRRLADGSLLIAVADGMGGLPGGDKAASLAIGAMAEADSDGSVDQAMLGRLIMAAHKSVIEYALRHPALDGMGTTLTAAVVRQESVFWAHVGDSRLYLLHNGSLSQLTTDHRFLSSMIADGDITAEQAKEHPLRNLLDQCLGCSSIMPETGYADLAPGSMLLLCSDGLYEDVSYETLTAILNRKEPIADKASLLVRTALENGGRDNVTLVIVERDR